MLHCISVENMRESDARTIATTTPSLTLMYRAAMGVFRAADYKGNISIVCGGGNNGGDGYALACILFDNNIPCTVFSLSDKLTPDSQFYRDRAVEKGVKVIPFVAGENLFSSSDIIVDCLLGTGFKGDVREPLSSAIREINDSGAFVVSVDINSGMNGDTGEGGLIVKSDLTVTIGFIKTGLVSPAAHTHIGRLVVADIGIRLEKQECLLFSENEKKEEYAFDERYIPMPDYVLPEPISVEKVEFPYGIL